MAVPQKEGFYWGRWHTPAPGTADGGECCSGEGAEWEVHRVVCTRVRPLELMAFVLGVEKLQPLNCFEWGVRVSNPYVRETA